MGAFLGVLLGLVSIVVIIGIWILSTLNGLKRFETKLDESEVSIDTALHNHFELLGTIIKQNNEFDRFFEDYKKIIKWFNSQPTKLSSNEKHVYLIKMITVERLINDYITSNQDDTNKAKYNALQKQLQQSIETIQVAKRLYNSNVSTMNSKIVTFPTSIVAGMVNVTKRDFFEAECSHKEHSEINF